MGAHLFVLIHGLFGNPVHLTCLRQTLVEKLPEDSRVEIFVPVTNAGLKSFDGIKLGAERIMMEFNDYLVQRKEEQEDKEDISHISIIGYSLGGLYARYFIGMLQERGYFEVVKPFLFTTFATPHVGSSFYSDSFHARLLNFLGGNILGVSGNDLFANGSTILQDMADTDKRYYKGLKRFKHLMLFSNAIHDRTVPFFTAYICDKDPFQKRDFIEFVFFADDTKRDEISLEEANGEANQAALLESNQLPSANDFSARVSTSSVSLLSPTSLLSFSGGASSSSSILSSVPSSAPFFIDMEKSQFLTKSTGKEAGPTIQERQFYAFTVIALPWLLPILMAVTSVTTIVSHLRVREAEKLAVVDSMSDTTTAVNSRRSSAATMSAHNNRSSRRPSIIASRRESIEESNTVAEWAGDVVDEVLAPLESTDADVEPKGIYKTEHQHLKPSLKDGYLGLLDSTPDALNLQQSTRLQIDNLNRLHWEKFAVKLERMHSHAEIVNRRNKPGQGQKLVSSWVDIVVQKLKQDGLC